MGICFELIVIATYCYYGSKSAGGAAAGTMYLASTSLLQRRINEDTHHDQTNWFKDGWDSGATLGVLRWGLLLGGGLWPVPLEVVVLRGMYHFG